MVQCKYREWHEQFVYFSSGEIQLIVIVSLSLNNNRCGTWNDEKLQKRSIENKCLVVAIAIAIDTQKELLPLTAPSEPKSRSLFNYILFKVMRLEHPVGLAIIFIRPFSFASLNFQIQFSRPNCPKMLQFKNNSTDFIIIPYNISMFYYCAATISAHCAQFKTYHSEIPKYTCIILILPNNCLNFRLCCFDLAFGISHTVFQL